jgi:hypothetical protein
MKCLPVPGQEVNIVLCVVSLMVPILRSTEYIRGRIQKFPDWADKEINNNKNNNNKQTLRSNTKGYGGKIH